MRPANTAANTAANTVPDAGNLRVRHVHVMPRVRDGHLQRLVEPDHRCLFQDSRPRLRRRLRGFVPDARAADAADSPSTHY
jgi:hypothetical protein